MSNNMILGSEISNYRTIGIGLGVSKKENRDGVKSRFMVFTLKNARCMMSKKRTEIFFDDDLPGLFDILNTFASQDPTRPESKIVDMKAFRASEFAEEWKGMLEIEGGAVMPYKLRKGACYANDVDGNRTEDANHNPVVRDTINVFVIIDKMMPSEDGGMKTLYFDGFDPDSRGQRLEARFWRTAVSQNAAAPTVTTAPATASEKAPEAAPEVVAPSF